MPSSVASWFAGAVRKRVSVVATAAQATFRPTAFAGGMAARETDLKGAARFFLASVGIVLLIEAGFSFAFDTAFSDIVHHAFPILVVLAGGFTIYLFLMGLLTPGVRFGTTMEATLLVGGSALLVMITTIFALLTADFLVSYAAVKSSPCADRTIICLLSGGSLREYDVPQANTGALGWSFPFILIVMLASAIHYSRVLAKVLRATMGVPAWRTYTAAAVSIVLLTPLSLGAINAVYRLLYRLT